MHRYAVGDILGIGDEDDPIHVKVLEIETSSIFKGEIVKTREGYYSVGYINRWLLSGWRLVKAAPREPIEKQLVTKINQLYERQAWVQDGKPTALCYTKPPAPSAEKKDTTEAETTSQYIRTVTLTVSDADMATTRFVAPYPTDREITQLEQNRNVGPVGQFIPNRLPDGQLRYHSRPLGGLPGQWVLTDDLLGYR